jgi:LmbE family N-acetylglucosaminyl deacetylase
VAELDLLRDWCSARHPGAAPRMLVFAAHPDDDIIGLGGRMRVVGPRLEIAYVSDGAPRAERFYRALGFASREQYARRRHDEAVQALAMAGVGAEHTYELGAIDQGVVFELARVTRSVLALTRALAPDAVMTHPYEGGHPDHDATACAVHLALASLAREGARVPLFEFTSYHADGPELMRGRFMHTSPGACERVELADDDRAFKRALLSCHATQEPVWRPFPLEHEDFRAAPSYDFSAPPARDVHYERLGWGIRFADFAEQARRALDRFGVVEPC